MPIQDPLTQQIIGLCYRVANTLGHGFVEKAMGPSKGTGEMELEVKDIQ